jgi:catechol 2,3-dioxygenase
MSQVDSGPIFRSERFTHANLFVSDLDQSVSFWTQSAGLAISLHEVALKAVFLTNGKTHHDIAVIQAETTERRGRDGHVQIDATVGTRPGLNHLAFELASEAAVVEGYTRARRRDIRIERCLDHMVARSIYLRDPDGNGVEFYADMTARWEAVFAEHAGELVTSRWDPLASEPASQSHRPASIRVVETPGAQLRPRQIVGAALAVIDLERSVEFYTRVGGLAPRLISSDGAVLLAGPQDTVGLGLVQIGKGMSPGLRRLIFSLRDGKSLLVSEPDGITCEFRSPDQPLPDEARLGSWLKRS